jgi:hypothetical protein
MHSKYKRIRKQIFVAYSKILKTQSSRKFQVWIAGNPAGIQTEYSSERCHYSRLFGVRPNVRVWLYETQTFVLCLTFKVRHQVLEDLKILPHKDYAYSE